MLGHVGRSFLLLALCVLIVHSLPPANDECFNAITIEQLPFAQAGTTVEASKEHTCNRLSTAGDVWYTFTPIDNIIVDISLCEGQLPDFNTMLYLISGSCDETYCEFRSNDFCGTASKLAGISLNGGMTYYIVVSGNSGSAGTFELRVTESDLSSCTATPITYTGGSLTLPGTVSESGSPLNLRCSPVDYSVTRTSWYSIIPTANAHVLISTCDQATLDTVIIVARGSCDSLSCHASSDDSCGFQSSLITELTRGVQHFIIVTTLTVPSDDTYTLSITEVAPFNDDICSAFIIDGLPYYHSQYMNVANSDLPACADEVSAGGDVWYRFTPSETYDEVLISACESGQGYAVYLATGSSCSSIQCIESNASGCFGGSGSITTQMVAGTRYYIGISPVAEVVFRPYKLRIEVLPPALSITCPADFTRTAVRSTCSYPGSTGTPLISSPGGYNARVTKDPLPPYTVGSHDVVYTVTIEETDEEATCTQTVTINKPAGNFCIPPP